MDYRTNPHDYTPGGKVIPDREDHDWVLRKYGNGHDLRELRVPLSACGGS